MPCKALILVLQGFLLLILPLDLLRRKRTVLVLDSHDLIRALLARVNHLAIVVANVMPSFEHLALLALARVAATGVGELEGWCAPELE